MRVLITGHCGFVGRHLMRALMSAGTFVMGFDLHDTCYPRDIVVDEFPGDIDRVYHLAARTDAQSDDASGIALVNVFGTIRLLEKYGDKVVLASSSMVNYPCNPYALSKRACEEYAKMYGAAIVRFPNLWGDGGHSAIDKFRVAEVIEIRGSGEQLRTYAHVSTAVIELLVAKPGEIRIVGGVDLTVNDIAKFHSDKKVRRVPASPMDLEIATQVHG